MLRDGTKALLSAEQFLTGAVFFTNFKKITAVPVQALVREPTDNPYRGRIEFPLVRGDYLVITCTAPVGSADVVAEWGEQI